MNMRSLESRFAGAMLSLPEGVIKALLDSMPAGAQRQGLDPRCEFMLRGIELSGRPAPHQMSVAEAREEYRQVGGIARPPRAIASVTNRTIPGPAGDIPVRVYLPTFALGRELPALVYYHGGGWVIGDLDTHDGVCRELAAESGCVVIAVDYRLAPEHRFPAAVEDAQAAFRWVSERGPEVQVDPTRVAVGGDSAGGNLAAVVCQRALAGGGPLPAFQLLVYPVTDLNFRTSSYELYGEGHFLTRALMDWFRGHYLGATEGVMLEELCGNPDVSPLHAKSLEGLPSALMLTAEFDPLRDEGLAYARRLAEAGVEVSYRCHEGLIHGFANLHDRIPASSRAIREAAVALRLALSRP
jgi:acetyl esterase